MTRKAWYALLAAMVVGVAALSGSMLYRANPTAEAQSPTPTPDPPADLKIVAIDDLGGLGQDKNRRRIGCPYSSR